VSSTWQDGEKKAAVYPAALSEAPSFVGFCAPHLTKNAGSGQAGSEKHERDWLGNGLGSNAYLGAGMAGTEESARYRVAVVQTMKEQGHRREVLGMANAWVA